jgi:hypothetical protein
LPVSAFVLSEGVPSTACPVEPDESEEGVEEGWLSGTEAVDPCGGTGADATTAESGFVIGSAEECDCELAGVLAALLGTETGAGDVGAAALVAVAVAPSLA